MVVRRALAGAVDHHGLTVVIQIVSVALTELLGHPDRAGVAGIDEANHLSGADDVEREKLRVDLGESQRTLIGHFRHEIGHYYWDRLIKDTQRLPVFRNIFGDETFDYDEALKQYYSRPHSDAWKDNFISAYASSHPWEDWAETWAHYLHIVDTMETAYSFGMTLKPRSSDPGNDMSAREDIDPYVTKDFEDIIQRWLPLSFVMNSLNRSMGMKDSYPFVINEAVKIKLNFIHETIRNRSIQ